MSGKTPVWDAESWRIYKRLLGYTKRYWVIGVVTVIGMALDGGSLAAFTQKLRPMIDDLFAKAAWRLSLRSCAR